MKQLLLVVAASVLATAASAQTTPAVNEVRISGSQARIEYPAVMHNVWYDEFDRIRGTYYLSDGKTMQLSMWGNRMYAKIDGIDRMPLIAASPYVFVARNLQMKLIVDDPDSVNGDGDLHATVILAAPLVSSTAPADSYISLLARR